MPFATDAIQVTHRHHGVSVAQVVTFMSRVPCWRPLILIILTTEEIGSVWNRPLHCTKVTISICTDPSSLEPTRPSHQDGYTLLAAWSTTPHDKRPVSSPTRNYPEGAFHQLRFLSFSLFRASAFIFKLHKCCIPLAINEPLIYKRDRSSWLKRLTVQSYTGKIPA